MPEESDLSNHQFIIEEVEEVGRDLSRIRIAAFDEAYETFKKALPVMVKEKQFHRSHGLFRVANIGREVQGEVYIAKKMRCKGISGNDKFRVVFQVDGNTIRIIEIFFKGYKEIEDRARIIKYCCG